MIRAVGLAFALFAATGAAYADDHLGVREFQLGMTADKYVAARERYQWITGWTSDVDKGKPFFLVNGIKAHYVLASTTDGEIDTSQTLPKHAKNLPVWRVNMTFAREDAKVLRDAVIDKYGAECRQWPSGAEHKTPLDWWCTYETADEKLFLSADDSSVPENIRGAMLMIQLKHPRASLSGL
jgi:hypothetical protein